MQSAAVITQRQRSGLSQGGPLTTRGRPCRTPHFRRRGHCVAGSTANSPASHRRGACPPASGGRCRSPRTRLRNGCTLTIRSVTSSRAVAARRQQLRANFLQRRIVGESPRSAVRTRSAGRVEGISRSGCTNASAGVQHFVADEVPAVRRNRRTPSSAAYGPVPNDPSAGRTSPGLPAQPGLWVRVRRRASGPGRRGQLVAAAATGSV